jgi:hypothetical protein
VASPLFDAFSWMEIFGSATITLDDDASYLVHYYIVNSVLSSQTPGLRSVCLHPSQRELDSISIFPRAGLASRPASAAGFASKSKFMNGLRALTKSVNFALFLWPAVS